MPFAKRIVRDERGVVESALVIIPLMALFLITLEIIVSVNFRNIDLALAQGAASSAAISSIVSDDDEILSLGSPRTLEEVRVVITHRHRVLPQLIPSEFLSGRKDLLSLDLTGIAVMEKQP